MRKIITLFALILMINVNAQTNTDSLKDIAFKPIVLKYIEKAENIVIEMKGTFNKDTLKILATNLIDISGQLESDANKFYGHTPTSVKYGLVLSENVSYEPILTTGNKKPTISSCAVSIHDISCGIYWLHNKNQEKLNLRISKIESIILVMKESYNLN